MEIEVWRHDAAYYLESYSNKLKTEGRWINYYLFELLKTLNPYLGAALHLLFFGLFVLVAALQVSRSKTFATLITLLGISSTTLYIQLLWPVTTLPSFTILALATLLYRRMPTFLFFGLFGILFFGSMSNLYFFLPLLFIRDYLDMGTDAAGNFRRLIYRILIPWIAGYLIGYVVAAAMVYLTTGQAGIALAAWRQPTPVTGLAGLIANIGGAAKYFLSDLGVYLNMLGWAVSAFVLGLFCTSYYQRRKLFYLLLPLIVIPAIYVSTIPYGINLSFRTSTGIWLGLIFIFLVAPDIKRWEKPVYGATTVLLLIITSAYSQANLNWYKESTNYYLHELLAATPGEPQDYKGLILISELKKYPQLEQRINSELGLGPTVGILTMGTAPRWTAVAKQSGFDKTLLCTGEKMSARCEAAVDLIPADSPASPDALYSTGTPLEGWLVIRLNSHFGNSPEKT